MHRLWGKGQFGFRCGLQSRVLLQGLMGRIGEVNLGEATAALAELYNKVQALAEQEER